MGPTPLPRGRCPGLPLPAPRGPVREGSGRSEAATPRTPTGPPWGWRIGLVPRPTAVSGCHGPWGRAGRVPVFRKGVQGRGQKSPEDGRLTVLQAQVTSLGGWGWPRMLGSSRLARGLHPPSLRTPAGGGGGETPDRMVAGTPYWAPEPRGDSGQGRSYGALHIQAFSKCLLSMT